MSFLVTLPVIVPLAAFALTFACWRAPRLRNLAVAAGALASLGVAIALITVVSREGALAVHVGAWPAGFAIALAADKLSALMVLLAAIIGAATLLFAKDEPGGESRSPAFGPAAFLLLAGVNGAFVTADLFNLYVWFEVMLMGSFALLAIGGGARRTEGALKYVTLNLLSSAIFLAAAGAIYAAARSLSLAELSQRMPTIAAENPALAASFAVLLLVAFGIKAGLFPLFFWLPASYHTAPFAVSALFAGLLTKVGVYAMLRVLPLVFEGLPAPFELLLALAAFTMLAGVLGAISQGAIRRILGFHIVSQIGYIVVGVGLFSAGDPAVAALGIAAAIFYTAHHILVKANLYLIGGLISEVKGDEGLGQSAGLLEVKPWLALAFAIPALSLAGLPPLSGFWAKLRILEASVAAGAPWVVAAALAAGLLTLGSMAKIWNAAFWGQAPDAERAPGARLPLSRVAPVVVLAAMTLAIGLYPDPLLSFAEGAAAQILDPSSYLAALGVTP